MHSNSSGNKPIAKYLHDCTCIIILTISLVLSVAHAYCSVAYAAIAALVC